MKFDIIGKNIVVTDGLRSAVEDKIGKLEKYFTPDTEVHVSLSVEKERQKIKARQAEGIKLALAKGIHFGRKKTEIPENFYAECNRWLEGEQTAITTMRNVGMKKTTFYKIVNDQMPEIVKRC